MSKQNFSKPCSYAITVTREQQEQQKNQHNDFWTSDKDVNVKPPIALFGGVIKQFMETPDAWGSLVCFNI